MVGIHAVRIFLLVLGVHGAVEATLHLVDVVTEGILSLGLVLASEDVMRERGGLLGGLAAAENLRVSDGAPGAVLVGIALARLVDGVALGLLGHFDSVPGVSKVNGELFDVNITLEASAMLTVAALTLATLLVVLLGSSLHLFLELGEHVIEHLADVTHHLLLVLVVVLDHGAGDGVDSSDGADSKDEQHAESPSGLASNTPRDGRRVLPGGPATHLTDDDQIERHHHDEAGHGLEAVVKLELIARNRRVHVGLFKATVLVYLLRSLDVTSGNVTGSEPGVGGDTHTDAATELEEA